MKVTLEPIGRVKNSIRTAGAAQDWHEVVSQIVVRPELEELEAFSHLIVLYWMHRLPPEERLAIKVHPRGRLNLPIVGVFASRSPARPNPIGKATVRLLERRGRVLVVQGLDAINATPVLDIKPYIPGYDAVEGARAAPWSLDTQK